MGVANGLSQRINTVDKKYISGHNGRKYSDPTQYKREWNMRNKSKRTKYRRESRQKRKGILILYKGSTCKNCGYAYDGKNGCAFDFHHLREKSFGVSGNVMEKSIETLKKEADKCELMCAICHRREHSDEY